jgi:transcription elongation factor Elf1
MRHPFRLDINITEPIFHDVANSIAHIEAKRRKGEPSCAHCGSLSVRKLSGKAKAGMLLGNDCRDNFTVRIGTVMARLDVLHHKWLLAIRGGHSQIEAQHQCHNKHDPHRGAVEERGSIEWKNSIFS